MLQIRKRKGGIFGDDFFFALISPTSFFFFHLNLLPFRIYIRTIRAKMGDVTGDRYIERERRRGGGKRKTKREEEKGKV